MIRAFHIRIYIETERGEQKMYTPTLQQKFEMLYEQQNRRQAKKKSKKDLVLTGTVIMTQKELKLLNTSNNTIVA